MSALKTKSLACLLLAVMLLPVSLIGCNSQKSQREKFDKKIQSTIDSQLAAENDDYSLSWDDEGKRVLFECLKTGKIWSNIPQEYYLEGNSSANVNSTLNITISDTIFFKWSDLRGYTEAAENGRILCETIENGLRVTYYFDKYSISVPVNYILRRDSLAVSIDAADIREGSEDYLLVSVSLAPFLCSAQNSEDSYLFIPSGSGALMYTAETPGRTRTWSGEVYGTDASRPIPEIITNEETIRLPVFGVKDDSEGLLGIIEQGAEAAEIRAEAGNSRTGYSTVYPTLYFRGYDIFAQSSYSTTKEDYTRVSERRSQAVVTVGYYPLTGEDAGYNGMARRYKKYLEDTENYTISKIEQSPYSLNILGGTMATSSILGIPVKTLKSMTSFNEALEILKEITSLTGINPALRLTGYGDSGINNGKLAGGFGFASVFGSNKKLKSFCEENSIDWFPEFDLVRFNKSGGGFSRTSAAAKSAVFTISKSFQIKTPLRTYNESLDYRFLKRGKLSAAAEKLIKTAGKNKLSGISLTSLGDIAYSDFSEIEYYCKGGSALAARAAIEKAQGAGLSVASGTNAYSAASADLIFGTPLDSGLYNVFDAEIPFYQMVFRGSAPLYCDSVNLAANPRRQIMLAASTGTGLGFTVIEKYDPDYIETDAEKLYGAVFEDNKALISDSVKQYSKILELISDSPIKSYSKSAFISETIFENGIKIYANHSDTQQESPAGTLEAYGFKSE